MIHHVAITVAACACSYVVAEVVAVCAAPCGRFDAFLLLFQIEESEETSAITVTRGPMELTGGSAILYG